MTHRSVAREIALVFIAMGALTWVVTHVRSRGFEDLGPLLLAAAFLYVPLSLARREPNGARRFGIDLAGVLEAPADERPGLAGVRELVPRALKSTGSEFVVALIAALLVFPPFVVGFRVWHQVAQPFSLHLPTALLDFVLGQLVVVALPEEALFRGYFQTRLADLFPAKSRLLGVQLSLTALVLQAVLFALLHFVVAFQPARLAVFFPGLLFGYLRERRGGIGAAIWFHAMSNLLSEILTRGYL